MATQLEVVAQEGGSPHRPVTLTPQTRRLLEGPVLPTLLRLATLTRLLVAGALGSVGLNVFGWGIDALFALMACGLVSYGVVMVAVMRRELRFHPERS
jgi:fatty acid desaturase